LIDYDFVDIFNEIATGVAQLLTTLLDLLNYNWYQPGMHYVRFPPKAPRKRGFWFAIIYGMLSRKAVILLVIQ